MPCTRWASSARPSSGRARLIAQLLGDAYVPRNDFEALLGITDFLSGLTDRAAVALALRITGES